MNKQSTTSGVIEETENVHSDNDEEDADNDDEMSLITPIVKQKRQKRKWSKVSCNNDDYFDDKKKAKAAITSDGHRWYQPDTFR